MDNKYNKLSITGFILTVFPIASFLIFIFLDVATPSNIGYVIFNFPGANIVYLFSLFIGFFISVFVLTNFKKVNKKTKIFSISGVVIFAATLTIITQITQQPTKTPHIEQRRVSDIKQIQTALELYKNDTGYYPKELKFGESLIFKGVTYMRVIPQNPKVSDEYIYRDVCPRDFEYIYNQKNGGKSYELTFCLGVKVGDYYKKGINIVSPD